MRAFVAAITFAAAAVMAAEPGGDVKGPVSVPPQAAIPAPPPEPQIDLPAVENASLANEGPTLNWQPIPGATSYEIQRWKAAGPGAKTPQWKTQGYMVGLSWTDPKPPRKPAYYRLRAIRAGSPHPTYSPWSIALLYAPRP